VCFQLKASVKFETIVFKLPLKLLAFLQGAPAHPLSSFLCVQLHPADAMQLMHRREVDTGVRSVQAVVYWCARGDASALKDVRKQQFLDNNIRPITNATVEKTLQQQQQQQPFNGLFLPGQPG